MKKTFSVVRRGVSALIAALCVTGAPDLPAQDVLTKEAGDKIGATAKIACREAVKDIRLGRNYRVLVVDKVQGYNHKTGIAGLNCFLREVRNNIPNFWFEFSDDLSKIEQYWKITGYDAIILNNSTLLKTKTNPGLTRLVDFVKDGGALCVIHAGADSFYDSQKLPYLIGGLFSGHPWHAGGSWSFKVEKKDDPINKPLLAKGETFKFSDEIYMHASPYYDRARVNVLVSLDLKDEATRKAGEHWAKKRSYRADRDFAVSWTRTEGRGRVFYTSFGHDARAYQDPAVAEHILRGLFYTLKVEDAEVMQAQEQMAWFNPDAAKRVLAELKGNPKYDYAKHGTVIEKMIVDHARVRRDLQSADVAVRKAAAKDYQAYRTAMLANPVLDFDKILCVKRRADPTVVRNVRGAVGMQSLNAENYMSSARRSDNEIVEISNLRGTPAFRTVHRPKDNGIVRDLDLDFDASRIIFTGYRGTNNLLGIFEIPATGAAAEPTLVSPGEHYDVNWWDACYLPNRDQIVMLGTAAYQFLPCEDGNMQMAVLYRLDRKTGEIRQLTYEQDSDYTPNVTHDGRVMYTRWEYSDLAHYWSRILMTMNPDGVGQLSLWGSGSYFPTFFYCARSIPGEPHKLTMIGGGHHDVPGMGRFFQLDPTLARAYPFKYDAPDRDWGVPGQNVRIAAETFPKEKTGFVHEFPGYGKEVEGDLCDGLVKNQYARGKPYFSHPWPLNGTYAITSAVMGKGCLMGLYLVDTYDNMTLIAEYGDGALLEAIPFMPRPRPPVIPDRSVKGRKTCSVHIADIYMGDGLKGVPRGTVKQLRLFTYHYAYHRTGGHSTVGLDRVESGWDIKRIIGTVDVEADGSVCFEMPANTPVSIQPLDGEGRALQLMRSWVVGMPGERVSCLGCHEDNRSSVQTKRTIADAKYFRGEIQKIQPTDAHGVRPWGFANEMWPVVRKYCVGCHGDEKTAPVAKSDQGGLQPGTSNLTGRRIVMKDAESAYRTLHPYVRRPGPEGDVRMLTPLDFHASTSPLVQILEKGHAGVKMAKADMRKIYEWADLNVPFYGKWDPQPINIPGKENPKHWDGRNASFVPWTITNQVARRLEFTKAYANIDDNPEREYDDYAKVVAGTAVKPVAPEPEAPRPKALWLDGWPIAPVEAGTLQSGAAEERARVTRRKFNLGNGESMVFRRIPAGKFVMGSVDGYRDEYPQAVVEIGKPFWISETEVRNDQYAAFDPEHDSGYQDEYGKDHIVPGTIGNHDRMPVVRVSWNDAMSFCAWFSKTFGVKATLPTEAEWEWAARAGSDKPFPWGGLYSDFERKANFADRSARNQRTGGVNRFGYFTLSPDKNFPLHEERWRDDWFSINFVGRAEANLWGLYDMHGNAAEWTRSNYAPYPYRDDDGRNNGDGVTKKVVRGGSFATRPRESTSSYRIGYAPWQKIFDTGFRVVLEIDE